MFFLTSLASVLLFYPSFRAMIAAAVILPTIFGGMKKGLPLGLAAACLAWVLSMNVLITEVKRSDGKNWLYGSTWGSVVAEPRLKPGDIITGDHHKKIYAFIKSEGRFARGYYIFDNVESVRHIRPVAWVLGKRAELSDDLYYMSGGQAYLTQALALGDRRYMPPDVQDLYAVTGLGHLLAISGLHAGLYAGLVFFLFAFMPGKLRMLPVMAAMLLLIPFTGFKVTVMRAGLFVFCVMGAKFVDYHTDVRKLLLFMAGMFMLITPAIAGDISFILSFSAVYGLVYLSYVRASGLVMSLYVGLVSSACIMPPAAAVFGMFNASSVVSTLILIPVVTLQIIAFLLYVIFPAYSVHPIMMLDSLHLAIVNFFYDHSDLFFRMFKPDMYVIAFMVVFILYCMSKKRIQAVCVLLLVPYLPMKQESMVTVRHEQRGISVAVTETLPAEHGAYFPVMIRSKGFAVVDRDGVHVFFKGSYSDFKYKFLPYLQNKNIYRADTGTISLYDGENRLFKIDKVSEDYGGICINSTGKECRAVFHTKSNTYHCDDTKRIHILYNNRIMCDNLYLIKKEGELSLDENTYKRR